jgi:hypothetical protein
MLNQKHTVLLNSCGMFFQFAVIYYAELYFDA